MPRTRRLWVPGGYYHVSMRGNNKQVIFHNRYDIDAFLRSVGHAYEKYNFQIYSYCIMKNHFHMLIRSDYVHLSQIMMNINKRYSDYYRKKYEFVGQIYEKRYYSDRVKGPRAFAAISSYIHRNPVDTKIPLVNTMEDYFGSSYQFYKRPHLLKPNFLNTQFVTEILPKNFERSHKGYCDYCEKIKVPGTHSIQKQF